MKSSKFFFFALVSALFFCSNCKKAEPAADAEFYLPGEWEPQQSVWIGWSTYENKAGFPTNSVHLDMVRALVPTVNVDIAVQDETERDAVKSELLAGGVSAADLAAKVRFHLVPHNDIWFRDMGGIFLKNAKNEQTVVDFDFNGWGYGLFTDDFGRSGFELDETVDRQIATALGLPTVASSMVLEGGGIESNGKGTLLVTESVVFQRNPAMTKAQAEAELKRVLNAKKIIWLPRGVGNDVHAVTGSPYLVNGEKVFAPITTNGHPDEFVRFVDDRTLLLAEVPESEATDTIARFSRRALLEIEAILKSATNQDGQPFTILRVPETGSIIEPVQPGDGTFDFLSSMPDLQIDPAGPPIKVVLASSYLNYVISNGILLVPKYSGSLAAKDAQAVQVLQKAFPGRKVVQIDVFNINIGGGGMHCITQQVPE